MNNTEESATPHTTYNKRQIKNYWGVYWLRKAKFSMDRIAKVVGISKATVEGITNRMRTEGSPLPGKPSGVPKKSNKRDERRLVAIVRSDPFTSYNKVNSQWRIHQINISRTTLIRYLKEIGFGSYFAAHKPRLSEDNIKIRLRWAKERVNWTPEQWSSVVWSGESRYTVEGTEKSRREVPATTYYPFFQVGKRQCDDLGLFLSGGFGPLVFIDQEAYVNILAQNFILGSCNSATNETRRRRRLPYR